VWIRQSQDGGVRPGVWLIKSCCFIGMRTGYSKLLHNSIIVEYGRKQSNQIALIFMYIYKYLSCKFISLLKLQAFFDCLMFPISHLHMVIRKNLISKSLYVNVLNTKWYCHVP
jgi:hypothetical protein